MSSPTVSCGGGGGAAPDATTTTKGIVELATDGETAANVAVQGNDSRLAAIAGKLAQGAGDTIADEEVVRGDAAGLQGSNVYITDGVSPLVKLGGTTSSFPALKRAGAGLQLRLADDSGWTYFDLRAVAAVADSGGDVARLGNVGTGGVFGIHLGSGGNVTWGPTTNPNADGSSQDFGLGRVAAGVGKDTDGAAGLGWRQWAGESYLGSDVTNETTTMAATLLSVTVKSGRKYGFKLLLFLSDSVAADGAKIDFAGGTATETNFRAQVTAFDAALALSTQLDDLADVASIATLTGDGSIEVHGSFEPASAGTFAPRFAQAAHTAGILTLYRGSHLLVWDMP